MRKQSLAGSLEEQCDTLYEMALARIAQGNFTGAVHMLKEIVKYAPDYKDAADLLSVAQQRKAEQRTLLLSAILGASVFVWIGTALQLPSDWLFLLLIGAGTLVGYALANLINRFRRRSTMG